MRVLTVVTAVTIVAASLTAPVAGQGWIEPDRVVRDGRIEKLRTAVHVTVAGRVARVVVEEWFRNGGPVVGEGTYHYPLPGEAVFTSYSLWQGDQELRGEMMDAGQARGIYESIVRQRKDPALIELAGHGLLRARVFPINPGETRKITLRYTQVLDRAGDAWRLRYPAEREARGAARSFRIEVDSAVRIGDPYSPTHQLTTRREDGRVLVTVADTAARGDLEMFLPLVRGLVGVSVVTHRPVGEDGFFMLLLAPGVAADAAALRRDVVAVVDVSGSMSGEKIEQAKGALTRIVESLRAGDRFRLVAFSSGVNRFAADWTPVTADARARAREWIRGLQANGGTNIAGALTEALAQPPAEGSLGVVLFLTDGLPTVGERHPERIAEEAERGRGGFRVFAFGVGYDVNTFLLDRLAERARGTTEYVQPGADIEAAVGALAAKISSPVLTDVAITAEGVELHGLQPERLPDLFAGEELVVLGRYRGAGEHALTVTGRRGGRVERFGTEARFVGDDGPRAEYVVHLWAARRAAALSREIRLHGSSAEVMQELKELALRYGILTEYTAYLVQEPNVVARREMEVRLQELRVPAPADQSGAGAVNRARRDNAAIGAASVAAAEASLDAVVVTAVGRSAPTQRVGGRLFVLRDSVWTDIGHTDSLPRVAVAPYSEAYFALLRALPELVRPAALEPAVVVAGRRLSIEIQASGKTAWGRGELERVVREFRE